MPVNDAKVGREHTAQKKKKKFIERVHSSQVIRYVYFSAYIYYWGYLMTLSPPTITTSTVVRWGPPPPHSPQSSSANHLHSLAIPRLITEHS